jgi:hypothetical protein
VMSTVTSAYSFGGKGRMEEAIWGVLSLDGKLILKSILDKWGMTYWPT